MEIVIFFLKVWSVIWTVISISMLYFFLVSKPKGIDIKFNWKTCLEWTLYITSWYAWFL